MYNTFNLPEDDSTKLKDIVQKFEEFIISETNETYERYKFNQRTQKPAETTDQFVTALKTLSATCNFCDCMRETLIRDQLVTGINSPETRKFSLQNAIDICRAMESSASQFKDMDYTQGAVAETVNNVFKKSFSKNAAQNRFKPAQQDCKFCGGHHQFVKSKYPAYGKSCSKCGGRNHLAKVCKGKKSADRKVRTVHEESDSGSQSTFDWVNSVKGTVKYNMRVNGKHLAFLIDSGASVNLLPEKYATHLVASTDRSVKSYCDTVLQTKGTSRQIIVNPRNKKKYSVEFVVVDNACQPIIGVKAAKQMQLLHIMENNFEKVASLDQSLTFDGKVGTLPGRQHLTIDSSTTPVVMPDRRVPIAVKAKLKTELDSMVERGIITPVTEPTPWVSQLVVANKPNGKITVCIDPKYLNKALQREHYTMPILDDVLHELSSSKVVTKVDLQNGYWHVELDEESSLLTRPCGYGALHQRGVKNDTHRLPVARETV